MTWTGKNCPKIQSEALSCPETPKGHPVIIPMSWILSCGRLPDTRTRVSIGRRWGDIQSWMLRFTSKLTPHHIPRLFVKHSQRCHVEVAPRDHPVDHPRPGPGLPCFRQRPGHPIHACRPEVHLLFQEGWFQGGLLWPWTLESWSEKEQTLPSTRWHVLRHFCHGDLDKFRSHSPLTLGEKRNLFAAVRGVHLETNWLAELAESVVSCVSKSKKWERRHSLGQCLIWLSYHLYNHHCYQSKRQNVRKQVKRLMVQKSVSPVEVGSLSHCSQGFIHPTGGWPWDFFHQKHKVFAGFWRPRFAGGQCRTERLGGRCWMVFLETFGETLTLVISDDIGIKGYDNHLGSGE